MTNLQIDTSVAVEVMGAELTPSNWLKDYDTSKIYYCIAGSPASEEVNLLEYEDGRWHQYDFRPSEYMNNAWQVVSKMVEWEWDVSINFENITYEEPMWTVSIWNGEDFDARCKSETQAICLAALKAVGVEVNV